MGTDDLFNLAFAHTECHKAENGLPSIDMIKQIEKRNQRLLRLLTATGIQNQHTQALQFAINFRLLRAQHDRIQNRIYGPM
jgi:hypothetical protein